MRGVNVDRMRRHQRRGRDTMRVNVDGEWVDLQVEWNRDGSVVLLPPSASGFPVFVSADAWAAFVERHGVLHPSSP